MDATSPIAFISCTSGKGHAHVLAYTHTSLRGDGGTAQEGKLKIRIENKDAWPMG
jgi:hypothetical protein